MPFRVREYNKFINYQISTKTFKIYQLAIQNHKKLTRIFKISQFQIQNHLEI